MARIRPFAALLPPSNLAARLSCPPYDVVNTTEARQFIQNDAHSFMRIIRAEAEWDEEFHPYDQKVYTRSRENFLLFQQQGWLHPQSSPHLFVYRLGDGEHVQTGVVACCTVDEYEFGVICRHENTKPEKENDRTQHTLALSAHPEPVLLAYRGDRAIDELVEIVCRNLPWFDFKAEDGVQHTLWLAPALQFGKNNAGVRDRENDLQSHLIQAFARIPYLYIADGHHRTASAGRVAAVRRAQNRLHHGEEEYNFFPAVLFPAEQLRILAYNRALRGLSNWQPEDFLRRLRREFNRVDNASAVPQQQGDVSVYCLSRWHTFQLKPETAHDPVALLDLSRLQKQLLEPYWGIRDQRTDARLDFIGGKNSAQQLQQLVDRGQAQIGISLFPPSLAELFAVSDRSELMPPKSTWFEPKLRSGLFVHGF